MFLFFLLVVELCCNLLWINDKGKGGRYVALCGWAARADDSFVCFGAKPDKGFLDLKSRRIQKWEGDANESWLDKGAESSWRLAAESWRGTTDRGSQHWTPETSGRQDRVQRRRLSLKMSAFELLVEFSLVTHASDSLHMHVVLHTFLCSWLTPSFVCVCSFVLLFSPFPQSYSCVVARNVRYPLNH